MCKKPLQTLWDFGVPHGTPWYRQTQLWNLNSGAYLSTLGPLPLRTYASGSLLACELCDWPLDISETQSKKQRRIPADNMVETFYYLLISNSSNCMYCNCLVTILDAWNSLKKFACYIVTDQVILVGGVGDWDRLDQVLPHCEIQRDANQDL